MGVDNHVHFGHVLKNVQQRGCVGGRTQMAFHHLTLRIHAHNVIRLHTVIAHRGRRHQKSAVGQSQRHIPTG